MLGLGHNIATPMVSGETPYSNDYYYTGTHATATFVNTNSAMQSLFRDSWTFSGWFNFDDGQTNPPNGIFGAKHDSNNQVICTTTKNASAINVSFVANGDTHLTVLDANSWGNGATGWQHVAVTCNKGASAVTITIYVNGSAPAQTSNPLVNPTNMAAFTNTQSIYIGAIYTGSVMESLRGDMDDVAFHSKALSSSEVSEIYNGGVSVDLTKISTSGDLVHYYTFNSQNGDDSGSGESDATFAEEGHSFNAHSTPTSAP
tara:strand:- start:336 stop:1112 length:777 start_codon:yes stop_codon:yes gene_type:complete